MTGSLKEGVSGEITIRGIKPQRRIDGLFGGTTFVVRKQIINQSVSPWNFDSFYNTGTDNVPAVVTEIAKKEGLKPREVLKALKHGATFSLPN